MEEDFGGENLYEYGRRQWRNGFGINERTTVCTHEESTKKYKYANGSVGARVKLMVSKRF